MALFTLKMSKPQCHEEVIIFWWKVFLDFQYFQFISPFRIKIQRSEKRYRVYATYKFPQKLLCAFQTLLGLICVMGEVRRSVPANPKNPSMYLYLCLRIVTGLLKLVQIKLFWCDQKKLVEVLNFVMESKIDPVPSKRWSKLIFASRFGKIGMILFCIISSAIAVQNWLAGRINSIDKNLDGHYITWWSGLLETGKYNIFLLNDLGPSGEVFVGILTAMGMLWRHLIGTCVDMSLLIVAATAWVPAKAFADNLQISAVHRSDRRIENRKHSNDIFTIISGNQIQTPRWIEIQSKYENVMDLMSMLNAGYGSSVCLLVLETILYYCTNSSHILFHDNFPDWHLILTVTYYLIVIGTALILSADVSKQVRNKYQYRHLICSINFPVHT